MEGDVRAEVLAIFPELANRVAIPAARHDAKAHEARLIASALLADAA